MSDLFVPFHFPPTGKADAAAVEADFSTVVSFIQNSDIGSLARLYISVKTTGAKGNGTADDTAAIQKAIDSVSTNGTVFFPAGTYLVTNHITLKNNVRLLGSGAYVTTLQLPQSNVTLLDYSMFEGTGDLSNITIESLGLLGNRSFQSTAAHAGADDGYAIQLNYGSLTNFTLKDCYIREFGDQSNTGGGIVIIPGVAIADATLTNLQFLNNHFGPNNGVPGIYVASAYGTIGAVDGLNITGNRFEGGGIQNCVYVLGTTANLATNINVSNNQFVLKENCDVCIEFNGVSGGIISNNTIRSTTTGIGTGILIRGEGFNPPIQTNLISITGNTLLNDNSGNKDGISLVAFDSAGHQDGVVISNNILRDYGRSTNSAIKVMTGVRNIILTANQITATAGTFVNVGIDVGDFNNVQIHSNLIKNTAEPIRVSGSTTNRTLTITDNEFNTCGVNSGYLIASTGGTLDLTGVHISTNRAYNSVSGTTGFVSLATLSSLDNIIFNNFTDIPENATYSLVVTENTQTINGTKTFAGQLIGKGTATNDSAAAGYVGEYIESVVGSTSVGTSGQYFDATSISLTAGDWDVTGIIFYRRNSATFTSIDLEVGISTTSGNSATGLTLGSNYLARTAPTNTSFTFYSLVIPAYRMSLAGSATVYLKGLVDVYTSGTPKYQCRLSARRVR